MRIKTPAKKLILSVAFGLCCCLLNAILVLLTDASITTYFTIGLIIPILITQQWGFQYGLISALIGYTTWSAWIAPSSNFILTILYVIATTLWVVWHGICASLYKKSKRFICNPYIAEIPFRLFYFVIASMSMIKSKVFSSFDIEFHLIIQTLNAFSILLSAQMITYIPFVRKILGLASNVYEQHTRRIVGFAFLMGISFWLIDGVFDYSVFYRGTKSLVELLFSSVPPHEMYVRTSFLIASFAGGLILARHVKQQIEQEKMYSAKINIFKVITEKTSDILAILDENYNNKYITPSVTAITGYLPEELIGEQQKAIIHPDDSKTLEAAFTEAINTPFKTIALPYFRIRHKTSHQDIWIEGNVTSLLDEPNVQGIIFNCKDITAKKHMQDNLIQSEHKYRYIMENISEGIWMTDRNAQTNYINPALSQMLGYTPDEMLHQSALDFINNEQNRTIWKKITTKNKDIRETYAFTFTKKDGTSLLTRVASKAMYDDRGVYIGTLATITDLSEWEDSQQKIRYMAKFPNENPNPVMRISSKGYLLYANESADILIKTLHLDKNNPLDKEWKHYISEAMKTMSIKEIELQCDDLFYLLHITPIHKESYINIYAFDITDRVKARHSLEQSERKYRELFENTRDGLVFTDLNGKFTRVNNAFELITGYSQDELLNMKYQDLTTKEWQLIEDKKIREQLFKVGFTDLYEKQYIHKNGSIIDVEVQAYLMFDTNNTPFAIWGLVRNITSRKETERALSESERKYRELFDNIRDGTVIVDMAGKILECNLEYSRMLGYTEEELSKITYHELTPSNWHDFEQNIVDTQIIPQGYSDLYEKEYRKKDGTVFPVEMRTYLVKDANNNPVGMWAIVRDVTERKNAVEQRERLLHTLAAKNEELESIVYVSSHDLRSPLVNISGFTKELENLIDKAIQLLNNENNLDDATPELTDILKNDLPPALHFIETSATKMDALLAGLTKLSRLGQASVSIQYIDMHHMFNSIIDSLRYQINEADAKVMIDDLPNCYGDALQISQVFANIVDNAIKYRDPKRRQVIKISGYKKDDLCIYRIKDRGIGIHQDHQRKIFEIFHRLDPSHVNPGDGLGLTIARRIIDKHSGNIWLESKIDEGTTFYVALPGKP